jgi:hypothetical protein
MRLALRSVRVEPVFGRMVRVYDEKGAVAVTQELSRTSGVRPIHPEHEEINRAYREKKEAKKSAIVRAFMDTFPEQTEYLEVLRKAHGPNLYAHLKEIVSYTKLYTVEEVSKTLSECAAMGAFHKNTVKRLLSTKMPKLPAITSGSFAGPAPLTRNLSVYREVVHE